MPSFTKLAIENSDGLMFGRAPKPVTTRRGLVIGGGRVYPELNFTVPVMEIRDSTFSSLRTMYRDVVEEACRRAADLYVDGFVIEFETLTEMTLTPRYAIELTSVMNDVLESWHAKHGLKTAIRVTPNDLREFRRPPMLRSGELLDKMLETFAGCAGAGGELLSIESTGGKELHDPALLMCDIQEVVFALGVLASRDMRFLWKLISGIARSNGTVAGGDTACGFGNTAMMLAEKRNIPKCFAAVVRAATAARSLIAYEEGAVGPGKDCGYENVYLKAVTGLPMSMEGKSAACAHLSPVGNVAAAAADLWSNESVQTIKLLGGMAPTVSFEQLTYDCRLMNRALETGREKTLQSLLVESDAGLDPQALILAPEPAMAVAKAVVNAPHPYGAVKDASLTAVRLIREACAAGKVLIDAVEMPYLDRMEETLTSMPATEQEFIDRMMPAVDRSKFHPAEYGI
jgi:methanol---5-hydroxybenzimidazolylcobamide Co-methyltransferase